MSNVHVQTVHSMCSATSPIWQQPTEAWMHMKHGISLGNLASVQQMWSYNHLQRGISCMTEQALHSISVHLRPCVLGPCLIKLKANLDSWCILHSKVCCFADSLAVCQVGCTQAVCCNCLHRRVSHCISRLTCKAVLALLDTCRQHMSHCWGSP